MSAHNENVSLFNPIPWFQFADNAAVVATDERENHLLLKCFKKLSQRSAMIIKLEKRCEFRLKKFATCSVQFQPKLLINKEIVPAIISCKSFRYLGRYFIFEKGEKVDKEQLQSCLLAILKHIHSFQSYQITSYFCMIVMFSLNSIGLQLLKTFPRFGLLKILTLLLPGGNFFMGEGTFKY